MSKVVAPLQSFSASGKIGKSIVFFSHLGRNVVRALVTPQNPQTEGQGAQRLMLGGLGRASRAVVRDGAYYLDVTEVTPAGQTWVSYLVRQAMDFFGTGATGVAAVESAVTEHSATNWDTVAEGIGLSTVTVTYAGEDTEFTPEMQLYILAVHAMNIKAVNPSLFERVPYTTALASWDSDDVIAFAADLSDID